jgi:hypothetical protein
VADECQYDQQDNADAQAPTYQFLFYWKQRLVRLFPELCANSGFFFGKGVTTHNVDTP